MCSDLLGLTERRRSRRLRRGQSRPLQSTDQQGDIAILITPVAGLLVVEVVVPRAANTMRRERLGGVVRGLARRGR